MAVDCAPDRILSRLAFLKRAVRLSDQDQPLATIIDKLPAMVTVPADETLEAAFQAMLRFDTEDVFVTVGGAFDSVIGGHIDCQSVLSFLHRHEHVVHLRPGVSKACCV